MKSVRTLVALGSAVVVLSLFGFASQQDAEVLDGPKLKTMITNLGHEVKELNSEEGKEKFEFKMTAGGLDIPVAAEISSSKNYLWLTVFLGEPPAEDSLKNAALLKSNFTIQPCQFYVTAKGNLMMGIAIDNRCISPAVLLRNVKKITDDVAATQDIWNK